VTVHAAEDELALLKAAATGDEDAFANLVDVHRAELHAHCYRMLGSLHDAEDVLQETLLKAWRGLNGFEGRSSVRSWLYAIATNAALDAVRRRARRELPVDFGPSAGPGGDLAMAVHDPIWLEPYPDRMLAAEVRHLPEARYEQRESIELAFMVALQGLSALQRAVFLLREVIGFSAAEIAVQLGTTTGSVTSALQRARTSVQRSLPERSQQATLQALGDAKIRDTVQRYADALERGDADTLIGMITQDAIWSMPPIPTWFAGRERVREFLVRWPLTYQWQHVPVRANGQLAVACYLYDADESRYFAAVIDVLTMAGDKIAAVTAFMAPEAFGRTASEAELSGVDLFDRFGLPATPVSLMPGRAGRA